MPNVFRNSPIDSLTQSVNALRSRQLQSQDNQVRMMELGSDLAMKDAERQLLPKRLEMEETRLGYEIEMGKMGMDIEVAKTAEGILNSRMDRSVRMMEEMRKQKYAPYELAALQMETRALAMELAALPVLKRLDIITKVNMNSVIPAQKLAMSTPALVEGQQGTQASKITAQAVMGESIEQFTQGMFTLTPSGLVLGIKHNGMRQLYNTTLDEGGTLSEGGFAGGVINDIMMGASDDNGFFDENGEWTNPKDSDVEKALIEKTKTTFEPMLISLAIKDRKKFAPQIKVLEDTQQTRDMNQPVDHVALRKEKEAKQQILSHITLEENGKFKFHDNPQGGSVALTIWQNFFGGPNAVVSAKSYMSASNDFNKAEALSSGMIKTLNETSKASNEALAGKIPKQAQDLIAEMDSLYIEYDEYIEKLEKTYGIMSSSEMSVDMFSNPSDWGIYGMEPMTKLGEHLFGEKPTEEEEKTE